MGCFLTRSLAIPSPLSQKELIFSISNTFGTYNRDLYRFPYMKKVAPLRAAIINIAEISEMHAFH